MSLFPAYTQSSFKSGQEKQVPLESTSQTSVSDLTWLENPSFPSIEEHTEKEHKEKSESDNESKSRPTKKLSSKDKKKKKNKKKEQKRLKETVPSKPLPPSKIYENDSFFEDRKQERGHFLVETLHRPAIPRYNKNSIFFRKLNYIKKKLKNERKIKRYFSVTGKKKEDGVDNSSDPSSKEEELTKSTENFNKRLAENPSDVELWLEYVSFQDTMYQFEKVYRRNPIGGERVTAERKLAILERAIQNNPSSERLMVERIELVERSQSADKIAEECTRALLQDPGSLVLWRTLVRTVRNNTSRCSTPRVLELFTRAITRLSQLRVFIPATTVEKHILFLVLECGLYLQQAGLWEQLWMLLQMYLSLSLTVSGKFTVPDPLPEEDNLREEEDSVVTSGLPLSVLWLRVEKLRAASHYLPEPNCEIDPQRVVFSDDMAGLLQPVMSSELRLLLVVSTLVLLKVPLLPTRHSLLQCLGLLDVPSALNNVETLTAALAYSGISSSDGRYMSSALSLISEPQLMREQQGRQQFLSWVLSVLKQCAELLPNSDAVLLHAWSLRLYALLCRLHCLGLGNVPASVIKQARTHAKQLLNLSQYRDNLLLYTEYALLERLSGDLNKAIKVLETATSMPCSEQDVNHILLCRRLVECLLARGHLADREQAVRVLSVLGEGLLEQSHDLVERHKPLATQSVTLAVVMTPQLIVEWLACQALRLYLTQSIWDAAAVLQEHIDLLPHSSGTLGSLWKEQLYEVMVDLLLTHTVHTKTSFAPLRNTLCQALKLFPNNLVLLDTLATIETRSGGGGTPLWKLVSFFPTSHTLARIILVFVVHSRVSLQISEDSSGTHYLGNLFRQLTEERVTSECPLMWRLYLQFVAAVDSPTQVKHVFYKSLQQCPWVKALYLDAVKFLPEELPEIQDLLIEKELRLHTTPEEIEVLRE